MNGNPSVAVPFPQLVSIRASREVSFYSIPYLNVAHTSPLQDASRPPLHPRRPRVPIAHPVLLAPLQHTCHLCRDIPA